MNDLDTVTTKLIEADKELIEPVKEKEVKRRQRIKKIKNKVGRPKKVTKGNPIKSMTVQIGKTLHSFNVNGGVGKNLDTVQLQNIFEELQASLCLFNRIRIIRYDFQFDELDSDNKKMGKCIRIIKKYIVERYSGSRKATPPKVNDIGYFWTREKGKVNGLPHYHMVILVDAGYADKGASHGWLKKTVKNGKTTMLGLNELLEPIGVKGINAPKGGDYDLRLNDLYSQYSKAIKHLSYLAKTNTKEISSNTFKNYGHSQIKKRVFTKGWEKPNIYTFSEAKLTNTPNEGDLITIELEYFLKKQKFRERAPDEINLDDIW